MSWNVQERVHSREITRPHAEGPRTFDLELRSPAVAYYSTGGG